jgi:hypothetical protein
LQHGHRRSRRHSSPPRGHRCRTDKCDIAPPPTPHVAEQGERKRLSVAGSLAQALTGNASRCPPYAGQVNRFHQPGACLLCTVLGVDDGSTRTVLGAWEGASEGAAVGDRRHGARRRWLAIGCNGSVKLLDCRPGLSSPAVMARLGELEAQRYHPWSEQMPSHLLLPP